MLFRGVWVRGVELGSGRKRLPVTVEMARRAWVTRKIRESQGRLHAPVWGTAHKPPYLFIRDKYLMFFCLTIGYTHILLIVMENIKDYITLYSADSGPRCLSTSTKSG